MSSSHHHHILMPSFSLVAAVATASDNAPFHTPVSSPVRSETVKAKRKRKAEDVDITRLTPKRSPSLYQPCQVRARCFPPHTHLIRSLTSCTDDSNFPAHVSILPPHLPPTNVLVSQLHHPRLHRQLPITRVHTPPVPHRVPACCH